MEQHEHEYPVGVEEDAGEDEGLAQPGSNGAVQDDFLAEIREARDRIGQDKRHKMDIPGYNGKLVAEYRRLEYKEVDKLADRARRMREKRHPLADLYIELDTIALACVEIYLRKDGELEPLSQGYPWLGEGPIKYDGAVKLVLKDGEAQPENARQAVRLMFANDLAVTPHYVELSRWMQESRDEEDEDFTENS